MRPLALAGFDALAPDLYYGVVVPYHDTDAAGKEMNSLDFMDATTQNVRGAALISAGTAPRSASQVSASAARSRLSAPPRFPS